MKTNLICCRCGLTIDTRDRIKMTPTGKLIHSPPCKTLAAKKTKKAW